MSDTARITLKELQPLPRWARLALAARCLRRARSLVRAPAEQIQLLDAAVARVEQATHTAVAGDDLADAAAAAYTLALDNLDARGRPTGSNPAEEDTEVVTCMVAHATAFAAEAATLPDPRAAAHLVNLSVDFAIHAHRVAGAGDTPQAPAGMRDDLQRLRQAAQRGRWTDQTPVPADFFA